MMLTEYISGFYLCYMDYTAEKLADLQRELAGIVKEVQDKKLTPYQAADKIIQLKEQIDGILHHLNAEARRNLVSGTTR